jgi:hypothetical protein
MNRDLHLCYSMDLSDIWNCFADDIIHFQDIIVNIRNHNFRITTSLSKLKNENMNCVTLFKSPNAWIKWTKPWKKLVFFSQTPIINFSDQSEESLKAIFVTNSEITSSYFQLLIFEWLTSKPTETGFSIEKHTQEIHLLKT